MTNISELDLNELSGTEILLFKMRSTKLEPQYALGQYDPAHDVFYVWYAPGYDKSIGLRLLPCKGYSVNLPLIHGIAHGISRIEKVAFLDDVVEEAVWEDFTDCGKLDMGSTYLVALNDGGLLLSKVGIYCGVGDAFSVNTRVTLDSGYKRSMNSMLPDNAVVRYCILG